MKTEKISEFARLTRIFPRKALNLWNTRREKKRIELYNRLVDSDLTLKGLLLEKKVRPESDFLEKWVRIQARIVDHYGKKYEKASRKIVNEVFQ